MRESELSAYWIYPLATISLSAGQIIGPVIGNLVLIGCDSNREAVYALSTGSIMVLLLGALFLLSSRNLKTGWGAIRPSENERANDSLEHACERIARRDNLTPREKTVFNLIAKGRSVPAIAESLIISQQTAKTHVRNIYVKLNVHSKQELIDLVDSEKEAHSRED